MISAPAIGCMSASVRRSASAGGQLEQHSYVNSSTNTVFGFDAFTAGPCVAYPSARTLARAPNSRMCRIVSLYRSPLAIHHRGDNRAVTRPTSPTRPTRLLRLLGLGFGIAVVIGGTIGVGILRTPGSVVARLGSEALAIAVWVLGGVYALLGALALAELGTMTPETGGYFAYARRAFGPAIGFAVGWCDLLVYCTALAYLSIAIGEFTGALAPRLVPHAKAIAIATLLFSALLQWSGLRISSWVQEIVSALKAVGFIGLAVACLTVRPLPVPPFQVFLPFPPFQPFPPLVPLILAFQLVIGTYGGWYSAIYFTEEDTEPARHLPRALITGVLLLTFIYVAVNLAFMAVLPIGQLGSSDLPAADAAVVVFGSRAARLITLLSIVSLVGIINPLMMIATRVLFAIARDRRASR